MAKKWIYVQADPNTPIQVAFLNKLVKVIPQEAMVNESIASFESSHRHAYNRKPNGCKQIDITIGWQICILTICEAQPLTDFLQ